MDNKKTLRFEVELRGSEEKLKDITAFEICEAIHKAVGEIEISAKEIKEGT